MFMAAEKNIEDSDQNQTGLNMTQSVKENITQKTFSSPGMVKTYSRYFLKEIESRLIGRYLKKNERLLDLGCGAGRTTAILHEMGFDVIGGDISQAMVEEAKYRFPGIDFMAMDACRLGFRDKSFSQVLFSFGGLDCIHPGKKREQAIHEIRRIMVPGGVFIFSSHNPWWLPASLKGWKKIFYNLFSFLSGASYRFEITPHGRIYVFYQNPYAQRRDLMERYGFSSVTIEGVRYCSGLKLLLFEQDIHYVCIP
jgi:SAM-dependent methyltransferase